MKFGVCMKPQDAGIAKRAGFSYIEGNVQGLLKPTEDDAAFEENLTAIESAELPMPVCNCFVPGKLKITGPDVDFDALQRYAETACARANRAGVSVIVFGSGGARQIPEGFDRNTAWDQLRTFSQMVAPIAATHQVTIVLEPLRKAECNIITSVHEGAKMVREVDHPAFRLLVDAYHWAQDQGTVDEILESGSLFQHTHIATYTERLAPGLEPCDFSTWFDAMQKAGYTGRISIEGKIPEPEKDLPQALQVMRDQVTCTA